MSTRTSPLLVHNKGDHVVLSVTSNEYDIPDHL